MTACIPAVLLRDECLLHACQVSPNHKAAAPVQLWSQPMRFLLLAVYLQVSCFSRTWTGLCAIQ